MMRADRPVRKFGPTVNGVKLSFPCKWENEFDRALAVMKLSAYKTVYGEIAFEELEPELVPVELKGYCTVAEYMSLLESFSEDPTSTFEIELTSGRRLQVGLASGQFMVLSPFRKYDGSSEEEIGELTLKVILIKEL